MEEKTRAETHVYARVKSIEATSRFFAPSLHVSRAMDGCSVIQRCCYAGGLHLCVWMRDRSVSAPLCGRPAIAQYGPMMGVVNNEVLELMGRRGGVVLWRKRDFFFRD